MSAAVASRALGINAATIRKWVQRGRVHRDSDGQVDPGCLRACIERDTLTETQYVARHDELCHTFRSSTTV